MLQILCFQSYILLSLFLLLLADFWSWFVTLSPFGLLVLELWPHSGTVGLSPVSWAILISWLVLVVKQQSSCSSLTCKGLYGRKKAADFFQAWFLVAKPDVLPPECAGRYNEFSISSWVCDVLPGWSWISWSRREHMGNTMTLLWVFPGVWYLLHTPLSQ